LKGINCQACCSDVAIVDVEGEWVCRACILMLQNEPQDSVDYSPHWTSHPVIVNSSRFDVDLRFCICASTPSVSCSDCPVHGIGRRSLFGVDLTELRHQGGWAS